MGKINHFTIYKILLGLLLFFIVGYGAISFLHPKLLKNTSTQFYLDSMELVDDVKMILSDKASCTLTLGNKNPQFDEISKILNAREHLKGQLSYEVTSTFSPYYKKGRLVFKSIQIIGNSLELGVSKSLTLLRLTISQNFAQGKVSTFEFPVHTKINDLGRIEECFTLSGIQKVQQLNSAKSAWQKAKAGDSRDINYENKLSAIKANGTKVFFGPHNKNQKSTSQAALFISAPLKLADQALCFAKHSGLLKYSKAADELSWCNEEGKWESLSSEREMLQEYKDFKLVKNDSEMGSLLTQEDYAFCEVKSVNQASGTCFTRVLNTQVRLGKWELMAQHSRGKELVCSFRCYR